MKVQKIPSSFFISFEKYFLIFNCCIICKIARHVEKTLKIVRLLELALGDQVAGIAGLKSQLQVAGTATTTSTADVSHTGEELDEMKQTPDAEANQASPLNGPNGAKVSQFFHNFINVQFQGVLFNAWFDYNLDCKQSINITTSFDAKSSFQKVCFALFNSLILYYLMGDQGLDYEAFFEGSLHARLWLQWPIL